MNESYKENSEVGIKSLFEVGFDSAATCMTNSSNFGGGYASKLHNNEEKAVEIVCQCIGIFIDGHLDLQEQMKNTLPKGWTN